MERGQWVGRAVFNQLHHRPPHDTAEPISQVSSTLVTPFLRKSPKHRGGVGREDGMKREQRECYGPMSRSCSMVEQAQPQRECSHIWHRKSARRSYREKLPHLEHNPTLLIASLKGLCVTHGDKQQGEEEPRLMLSLEEGKDIPHYPNE